MTTSRNLVLLLVSGHTVRVKLRDDDFTEPPSKKGVCLFLESMPAIGVVPFIEGRFDDVDPEGLIMAYVEDPSFPRWDADSGTSEPENDFQRIEVLSPGDVGSAA